MADISDELKLWATRLNTAIAKDLDWAIPVFVDDEQLMGQIAGVYGALSKALELVVTSTLDEDSMALMIRAIENTRATIKAVLDMTASQET